MGMSTEEFIGTFRHERYRSQDSNWAIGIVATGETITGCSEPGELHSGIPYRFLGKWDSSTKYGRQFKFSAFVMQTPTSRQGMTAYLKRYLPGIGAARANMLIDRYGVENVIGMIRDNPEKVAAETKGLTVDQTRRAAEKLKDIDVYQTTKIELLSLLEGSGVQIEGVMQKAIERWNLKAAVVIRADPFVLLEHRFPGCGFATVDKLWKSLGLALDAPRRQVMAAWHVVRSDSSGSTWLQGEEIHRQMGAIIDAGVKAEQAIATAVEAGWIKRLEVGSGVGKEIWFADARNAESEESVVEDLRRLMA